MGNLRLFLLLIAVVQDPVDGLAQPENTKHTGNKLSGIYAEFGGGIGTGGGIAGISASMVFSNHLGATVGAANNGYKSEQVPRDFKETQFNIIYPRDHVNYYSCRFLIQFPPKVNGGTFGLEAGPSFVHQKFARFSDNPAYPAPDWWLLPVNKYIKSYSGKDAVGISMRANVIFPFNDLIGLSLSSCLEINKIRTFFGIEAAFCFGLLNQGR